MKLRESRVIYLGLNFPPEVTGIAPYAGSLVDLLTERCQHVKVFTTFPHYPQWKVVESSITNSEFLTPPRLSIERVPTYIPKSPTAVKRLLYEITFGIKGAFSRWGKRDLILLVSPGLFSSAIFAGRAFFTHRKSKMVVWVQDLYSRGYSEINGDKGSISKILGQCEKWLLNRADLVISIHERFEELIEADYGLEASKLRVIRNWAHSNFSPTVSSKEGRELLGWLENQTIVLHAGNMGVKQGLENVVKAAKIAQERGLSVKFVLVGDGVERESLQASAEGLTTMEFINTMDSESFQNALSAADFLLLNELNGVSEMAVPSKLTTYFQSGKPVIASTDLRGISANEIQLSMAGVIVPSGSPELLLDEIVRLSKDKKLQAFYGSNGRAFATNQLSAEASHSRFLMEFEELIRSKN